ncbi:hypothetical protein LP419_09855 [Massilia sp. H-1]|nr:hypothetical protein LP419_09855 [Massilia sp. H-1]
MHANARLGCSSPAHRARLPLSQELHHDRNNAFPRPARPVCLSSAAFGAALLALPAQAQQATNEPMQRVEITGSSIKRLAAQTSLPITSIRAGRLRQAGPGHGPGSAGHDPHEPDLDVRQPVGGRQAPAGAAWPTCAAWVATRPWCCSTDGAWPTTPSLPTRWT